MKIEFTTDPAAVRAAARARLLARVAFVAGLVAAMGMAAGSWVPPDRHTLMWSFALTLIAVYAGVEVSALQWAKRSTPGMRLRLGATQLECWIGTERYPLAYRDLTITRIVERDGRVRRIDLKTSKGTKLQLAAFEDMSTLVHSLTACLAEARADAQSTR